MLVSYLVPEWSWKALLSALCVPNLCGPLLSFIETDHPSLVPFSSLQLPLKDLYNNQAASVDGTTGDFDGHGGTYPAQHLPTGPWHYNGITYDLPTNWGLGLDNVVSSGQVITLNEPTYIHEFHIVYAGEQPLWGLSEKFELQYEDGSIKHLQFGGKNWWKWPFLDWGDIRTPFHFTDHGASKNMNTTHMYQLSLPVPSKAPLRSITLPDTSRHINKLHIFALTLTPCTHTSEATGPAISIRNARFTTLWEDVDGERSQVVEITIANILPAKFATSRYTSIPSRYSIEVVGHGLKTVTPGHIYRLVPGDQARVDVLVLNRNGSGKATVRIRDSHGNVVGTSGDWPITPLREHWTPEESVLATHETPTWWNKAKYGIFIHWGPYSVPGWGSPGVYAEWYNWHMHIQGSAFWRYHLDTYGPEVVYDDFIHDFTASAWDPSAWLDLIDEAGAKYFVFVTKHHDGYSLFDTKETTHRGSVYLPPYRDFLKELMETAKAEKPHIHRGTYYSLPEWYNPYYAKYGFDIWPGGLANHPYKPSEVEPYTGMLNITDYLDDLLLPHMISLAVDYETEIMWCDIGGPHRTPEFAAEYYNNAMKHGYQVVMNDRCGDVPDFDTPEYARYGNIQTRRWETSEGMDPYSYGYNSATPASAYKNGTAIIQNIVDIVSKNGNYLLDIGPTAEGEIVAPMVENLLDAGRWLKYAGRCVYGTDYWYQGFQDVSGSVRFLTTPHTFCIVALDKPTGGKLVVDVGDAVLPLQPGDTIRLLGPKNPGALVSNNANAAWQEDRGLDWKLDGSGVLTIQVPESLVDLVEYAWAFEVSYA
ncbi:glycoside hydrolase family 29 protein [Pisolithus tinctorius Marx 270]|uniref:alpha-L-fucosidase n=1 Tax=Pisolithus tinctorius Marx 270 TaxID=870435 RepID=A0A0C3P5I1_PISTI|nr:glycoside hydrolase family 29 protein [Pisolithus tinctorius Marx 270]